MRRIFDGKHRGADGTLAYAGSPQAIPTKKAAVTLGTFIEKQVAIRCALAVNLLRHNGLFLPWKSSSAKIEQTLEAYRALR
jgi:hypothetical protein